MPPSAPAPPLFPRLQQQTPLPELLPATTRPRREAAGSNRNSPRHLPGNNSSPRTNRNAPGERLQKGERVGSGRSAVPAVQNETPAPATRGQRPARPACSAEGRDGRACSRPRWKGKGSELSRDERSAPCARARPRSTAAAGEFESAGRARSGRAGRGLRSGAGLPGSGPRGRRPGLLPCLGGTRSWRLFRQRGAPRDGLFCGQCCWEPRRLLSVSPCDRWV